MIYDDSRWNFTPRIRVVDSQGNLVENERVDLPYDRSLVVRSNKALTQDYAVEDGDTWSNIAARAFRGRSDLWWIIAEQSGVIDPFRELQVGRVLKTISFSSAMFEVLSFNLSPVSDVAKDVGA